MSARGHGTAAGPPLTSAAPATAGTGGRPRAQDAWLRRLAAYCWRHRRLVIMALGGSLLATLVQATIPLIMAWIMDSAILDQREPIWLGASVLIVAGLLSFAGVYTRRYRGGQLSLEVQHDMRTELFQSLERLDGARQDQLHTGQIVSRSISDLNMVQSLLSQMPMLIGNALLFVLSISIMAYLSPVLTLVALAIAPALWLIAIASRRKLFPASWDAQQKEAQVAGVVDGAVTGRCGVADRARDRLRRLGHQRDPDERGGPQRRADALHPAREDLLPSAAARPGLLRARDVRPDHDPDDDGRGRHGHVPADRADHHGQRGPDVRRRAGRAAVHQPQAGPHPADDHPGASGGHAGVPGEVPQGLYRPREGQHRQR